MDEYLVITAIHGIKVERQEVRYMALKYYFSFTAYHLLSLDWGFSNSSGDGIFRLDQVARCPTNAHN